MATVPCYYCLDLAKLRDHFREGVPFSDWCALSETAGEEGFPAHSLRQVSRTDLTPLQKIERVLGFLLYINISGAAAVWLSLGGLCAAFGRRRLAGILVTYCVAPYFLWSLFRRVYGEKGDQYSRYAFPYRHQHTYMHMKYVWPAELQPPQQRSGPVFFCIVPHGVLPFGIDYAFIDKIGQRLCRWVAAPILLKLPVIGKYLRRLGVIPANARGIRKAARDGENVGIILDGVAGMFQNSTDTQETARLMQRKGIIKIALQTGASLVPIYGFGHTTVLTPVVDPFKILERISIKLDTSIVPFFGRWGWPLGPPRRDPLAMAMGKPVHCPLTEEPYQAQIDEYHAKLLDSLKEAFDTHKAAYGWEKKELKFV